MDNKYFSVEEMNSLIENLELAFTDYGDKADTLISKCKEFQNDDSYTGERATVVKDLVGDNEVSLVNAQKDMQAKLLSMYKHAADSFAEKVDSAPNARLDLETLDMVESDLKAIYRDVDTTCAEIENIAKEMNAKYGHFGHITVPNADPLRESLENLCGGYNPEAGFYHDLKQKFINWDEEECAYIESQLLGDEIEKANSSVIQVNTTLDSISNIILTIGHHYNSNNSKDKELFREIKLEASDNVLYIENAYSIIKKRYKLSDIEFKILKTNYYYLLLDLYFAIKLGVTRVISLCEKKITEIKELTIKGITGEYYTKYITLTDDKKIYIDNIDKLSDVDDNTKISMRVAAISLFSAGVEEKEFVTGVLANISCEAEAGAFEKSNFLDDDPNKPNYIDPINMYSYDKELSGRNITEVGITKTIEFRNNIDTHDDEYTYIDENGEEQYIDLRFGIGMIQWTDDFRFKRLLELYVESVEGDYPTTIQCAQIEAEFIAIELTDKNRNLEPGEVDYTHIYDDWKKGDKTAYNAGYDICFDYERPNGYKDKSVERGNIAEDYQKILDN